MRSVRVCGFTAGRPPRKAAADTGFCAIPASIPTTCATWTSTARSAGTSTPYEVQRAKTLYRRLAKLIHPDIKAMLNTMKVQEYQIIVITDGNKGAYAYDGKKYYFCPIFPSDVVSTLGAGDAFASTFCGALKKTNINVGLSLMYGSVNSASVVSKFGATEGLLTFEEIEKKLKMNPDYTYLEC